MSYCDGYIFVTVESQESLYCRLTGIPGRRHHALISYPVTYLDTDLSSPCPFLLLPSVKLGSDNYHFCKSFVWLSQDSNADLLHRKPSFSLYRPPRKSDWGSWLKLPPLNQATYNLRICVHCEYKTNIILRHAVKVCAGRYLLTDKIRWNKNSRQ